VGDSTGYAPITLAVAASAGGTLLGHVDAGSHPDTIANGSGIDSTKSANHYWTLTAGTLPPAVTYLATFQFCANTGSCTPSEVDTAANTGNFNVALKSEGMWSMQDLGTKTGYSTQATGITSFGEFAVGEISTNNCFTESFTGANNASPGNNWSVGNKTGSFGNPVIYGNRLRLSNASTSVATWATLQRMIPAAGNKVTVLFDHFSYGGTHADGIGVILSDGSVAPQAGAFGGSLGYAQKGYTPVSDCTTVGGCPGFAGGWLGIGIDEYGNYSANTEGRYGGSPSLIQNTVAVRGSGSGMSGYRFLMGTSTLSPAIDSAAPLSPPHRYRIVVDHTDSVHAWTSVERDTSGGGTAYTTLIGCPPGITSGCTALDVKDPGYSQNAVPVSWNLSFTSATGAATNIHEIDNLSICTVQGLATPALHHIQIEHGGSGCTNRPAPVIVKACANAACTALYLNSVTVNLSSTGGTWSPGSPLTFSGGQTSVTLSDTTVRSDTLGAAAVTPTAGYTTQCFNGTTQTCVLTFNTCTFDVVEVGAAAYTTIFTNLANTAFSLDVLSLISSSQTATKVDLVDASSGSCSTFTVLAGTSTGLSSTFSSNQRKTFNFTYPNAAPNVRVRVTTTGSNYSCSTDNFAIRPQSFTVTSNATQTGSSGLPVFRAGTDTFLLAANASATAYTGIPKLNSGLINTSLVNLGILTTAAFPTATAGISNANGFTYSEVGNFALSQYAVYDDTFAQVDSVKGDCTSDFNNGPVVAGKFGCMFGSAAAGAFGRFVPDHFTVLATIINNACAAGTFTYMGQPFTLSSANVLEARNASNAVTKNYVAAYAHGSLNFGAENADNGSNLSARLTIPTGTWTLGSYALASTTTSFSRPVTTLADSTWGSFDALDIGLTVSDSDVSTVPIVSAADMNPSVAGGSSLTHKKLFGSPLRMRFGRMKLSNALGSELLNLPIALQTQYWNGTAFVKNSDDSCTTLATANFSLTNAAAGIAVTLGGGGVFSAGAGALTLSKPTNPSLASAVLCIDLGADPVGGTVCSASSSANLPYLQGLWSPGTNYNNDPIARATFGLYKGNNEFIYLREAY
jgi:MSHA biogenesis protein MshQ